MGGGAEGRLIYVTSWQSRVGFSWPRDMSAAADRERRQLKTLASIGQEDSRVCHLPV